MPGRDKIAERSGVSVPTAGKNVRYLARRGVVELDENAYWVGDQSWDLPLPR
jgi:hypothetical protein